MEMEFKDNSRRRRVLITLGVVLAIVAGGAAFYLSSQGSSAQAAEVPKRTVVVASVDIPARTVIQSSHLTTRELPDDPSVAQALNDPSVLIGRISGVPIFANQPVTMNLLATTVAGAKFSILGPTETIAPDSPNWRAVSVKIPEERAVAHAIEVGQRVDLFTTVQVSVLNESDDPGSAPAPGGISDTGYYSDKATKITFEDVEVLQVNKDEDLYILKVDLHQAEEISHIQGSGNDGFSLALRPDGDQRTVDRSGYGETNNRIIEQYNHPIPEMIDLGTYPQPQPQPTPVAPVP